MKPVLTILLIVALGAVPLACAEDPRPVAIEATPFESASLRQGVLVLKLKSPWLVDGNKEMKAGEVILVAADHRVKLVNRHTQVSVSFQPARGVLIETIFDARSLGGKIERRSEILTVK
jgi:hypothetical protein